MTYQLEVKNLSKTFKKRGEAFYALNQISFSLEKGELLSLVGPSGSGKSTLARILVGLIAPSEGEIFFEGEKLAFPFSRSFRPRLQMVFQEPAGSLNPRRKILELVAEPLLINKVPKLQAKIKAEEMILKMGLKKEHLFRFPAQVSGGEIQRVALARALIVNPEVLLLDEITSGLDPLTAWEILDLLIKLNQETNTTIIFITHNLLFARQFFPRIIFLFQGKLVGEISPEKISLLPPAQEMLAVAELQQKTLESSLSPPKA